MLLFNLAHPRWEFVFQPKYAAYLNLIEPWWKTMTSLAIRGRSVESCHQVEEAISRAVDYRNAQRRPYVWGQATPRGGRASGLCPPSRERSGKAPEEADRQAAPYTETCLELDAPKGSRRHPPKRSRSPRPAIRAMRSSSEGQA